MECVSEEVRSVLTIGGHPCRAPSFKSLEHIYPKSWKWSYHIFSFGKYCLGLQVALGADMRFSTPDCRFSIMESRWGLIPDMGASLTLRELVRIDVAKELTMTGRIVDGLEAEKIGLVTRCVDDPMEEAMKIAKEIIERSPDSVAATKALFQSTWVADEETCLKKETDLQKKLIATWNQVAASGRQFGVNLPYFRRRRDFS